MLSLQIVSRKRFESSGDYEEINEDKDYEPSVASIVYETNYLTGALKNDSATQECMVHWALCYATMKNVYQLNSGASFLERFIYLIQITFSNNEFTSRPNTNVIGLRNRFKLNTCPELVTFMSQIKIPYLLPPHNITDNIKSNLQGLCHFGTCTRQTGADIEFDLLYVARYVKVTVNASMSTLISIRRLSSIT